MAYTTNPKLPRLRAHAVDMVRGGKSVSEIARYFGYTKGAVSKWCKKSSGRRDLGNTDRIFPPTPPPQGTKTGSG